MPAPGAMTTAFPGLANLPSIRPIGPIYGLTYIDRNTKTVVNGSDLGKGYSAAPILKHFEETPQLKTSRQLDKPMAQHDSRSQLPTV